MNKGPFKALFTQEKPGYGLVTHCFDLGLDCFDPIPYGWWEWAERDRHTPIFHKNIVEIASIPPFKIRIKGKSS